VKGSKVGYLLDAEARPDDGLGVAFPFSIEVDGLLAIGKTDCEADVDNAEVDGDGDGGGDVA